MACLSTSLMAMKISMSEPIFNSVINITSAIFKTISTLFHVPNAMSIPVCISLWSRYEGCYVEGREGGRCLSPNVNKNPWKYRLPNCLVAWCSSIRGLPITHINFDVLPHLPSRYGVFPYFWFIRLLSKPRRIKGSAFLYGWFRKSYINLKNYIQTIRLLR